MYFVYRNKRKDKERVKDCVGVYYRRVKERRGTTCVRVSSMPPRVRLSAAIIL